MEHILVRTNGSQANQATALRNRELFEMANITVINVMSAPGAGKTSLLEATIPGLRGWYEVAVIEGDLQTELDAERIRALGVPSHQINTGKVSHLDAPMINSALTEFPVQGVDLLFIENVGNLICPAFYDLGEKLRLVVCSAVDGADTPKKYPTMFRRADAIVVNKVDLARQVTPTWRNYAAICGKLMPRRRYLACRAEQAWDLVPGLDGCETR